MAERLKFTGADIAIGTTVLAGAFVVVFFGAGAVSLPVPQWGLAAVAAAIGIIIWFAILRRRIA